MQQSKLMQISTQKILEILLKASKLSGIKTLQGIADALNNRGVKTYKDKVWYPTTVKNVLEREAA